MDDHRYDESEKSTIEKFCEIASVLIIIAVSAYTAVMWSGIPWTIATHFNAQGEPDGYGSKWTLLLMIVLLIIMTIGLLVVAKYPKLFNYMVKITDENRETQQTHAIRLLKVLMLEMTVIFGFVQWGIVSSAVNERQAFPNTILIGLMVVIFLTIGIYFYRSIRDK